MHSHCPLVILPQYFHSLLIPSWAVKCLHFPALLPCSLKAHIRKLLNMCFLVMSGNQTKGKTLVLKQYFPYFKTASTSTSWGGEWPEEGSEGINALFLFCMVLIPNHTINLAFYTLMVHHFYQPTKIPDRLFTG